MWRSCRQWLRPGAWVGWSWVPGNHQDGVKVLAMLMESSDLVLSCTGMPGWEEFNKGTMSLSVLLFPERVALTPALCWRLERVGLSGSQSVRSHFKRSTSVSSSPLSWTQSLLWFRQPDVIGTPLPSSGVPGWEPGMTLGCLTLQGGPPQPRCPSQFLITT